MPSYELVSLKLPKLTGIALSVFANAVENPMGRAALLNSLLENGGIPKLRRINLEEAPTFYPIGISQQSDNTTESGEVTLTGSAALPYNRCLNFFQAYQHGQITVEQVAEQVLGQIAQSDQGNTPMRAFVAVNSDDVMTQAMASTKRYAAGNPLGSLDGVPVAIKDEVDLLPYPTTVGTAFLGKQPARQDSTVAARLRAAGALLVGKTNMHEIGIAPNGMNTHHGSARNPYQPQCDTGGSSSGSGAAVAAGLVPAAIGADGGGSIRVPAALCGVVGLKPTFGRVSEFGAAPLCWSVAHLGPLAASVSDAALIYSVIAGPDDKDPNTLRQPPVSIKDWNKPDLEGVRLGIYPEWNEHAHPEVVFVYRNMLAQLVKRGAEVVEIEIPELDEMRIAHAITILAEMAMCMRAYRAQRKEMAAAVRLSLVLGEAFTALDYVQAQRVRTRAMAAFARIYSNVDVILSPATALAAQTFPIADPTDGWSDLGTDVEMMRYVFPGNLAGLPGISFPGGYDGRGLPVGVHAMANHWRENLLLRVAFNAEQVMERKLPQVYLPVKLG
jgi:Asp-tRNA(Asn)/Glu-tRNA(Gln) amidotransferase A subunit family amidase